VAKQNYNSALLPLHQVPAIPGQNFPEARNPASKKVCRGGSLQNREYDHRLAFFFCTSIELGVLRCGHYKIQHPAL